MEELEYKVGDVVAEFDQDAHPDVRVEALDDGTWRILEISGESTTE